MLTQMAPDQVETDGVAMEQWLRRQGWRKQVSTGAFLAGQPAFNFWLSLEGKTEADLLAGMNQLWRRNIKKADKLGVEVSLGGKDDLAAFHRLYAVTAERDHFRPRPLAYFTTMWDALHADADDRMKLYLAHVEGDLIAATIEICLGRHVWYLYGASSNEHRDARGSNAIQWRMIRDGLAAGATLYDMRGITGGLSADDSETGILQFKVGTGGEAVEYVGEWDFPISRVLYAAFNLYMNRHHLLAGLRKRR
jgi:lipid II:glycine glycyltransferase (peptidoglycan interpeptide bridge formation enzyme)